MRLEIFGRSWVVTRFCDHARKVHFMVKKRPNTRYFRVGVFVLGGFVEYNETFTICPDVGVSSIVVLDEQFRVLLVLEDKPHIQGLWHTPSGRIEEGELPIEAAKRELFEETGLQHLELVFLNSFLARSQSGGLIMRSAFLARIDSKTVIEPVFKHEIAGTKWVTKLEFDAMYDHNEIRMHHTKLFLEEALRFLERESKGASQ
jgi:8-oxo-dGTP diphosphatase